MQIYNGITKQTRAHAGVMIMIYKSLKSKTDNHKYWNERIMEVRMKTFQGFLTVIGVYAPTEGKEDESLTFYETLQKIINKISKNDFFIIMGDLMPEYVITDLDIT
jgi:exonuclease III